MPKSSLSPKGKRMPLAKRAKQRTKSSDRLQEMRERSACRVHKAVGDSGELRAEGLSYYHATKNVRARANQKARERE
jgi:hypothetical protein